LAKLRPSVHIVACSAKKESNPEFLLQAMRSGVRDFLQKPYDRIELSSLIDRVSGEHLRVMPRRSVTGKLFVVLGTKGGVGTSTVSVNLAVQLAKIPGKSTALLDFSRPMGDVAGFLDLQPSFQLSDAVENFKRLDPTLLSGLLTQHKSGLKVLAGASRLQDWQHASHLAIERLVEIAQQSFDFVVMDFGSFYSRIGKTSCRPRKYFSSQKPICRSGQAAPAPWRARQFAGLVVSSAPDHQSLASPRRTGARKS